MNAPKRAEVPDAAAMLREVLAKVDVGELQAPGSRDKALVGRIESAAFGLDITTGDAGRDP